MKTCIDLIEFEEFLEALNKDSRKIESYEKYLNELDEEKLVEEYRTDCSLADYMKYHYDFVKSLLISEVVNPCRLVSEDNPVPYRMPAWKNEEPEKQNETLLELITSIRMVADRSLDSFETDPTVPFEFEEKKERSQLIENCMDLAFDALTYYYRLSQLANRLEFEEQVSSYIAGFTVSDKFVEKLKNLPEIIVKDGLGIKKDGEVFNYRERIRTLCYLNAMFTTIEDDIY